MRFAGQYYDHETGLHYNYHRYYDPKLGRYLRADPIGLEGGVNPFLYTLANPINNTDPDGQLTQLAYVAIGTGVIIVGGMAYSNYLQQKRHRPYGGPIPPYTDNKRKLKQYNQPPELIDGGDNKGCPPPDDACEKLKKVIEGPAFKTFKPATKLLFSLMYVIGCSGNEITGGGGGTGGGGS